MTDYFSESVILGWSMTDYFPKSVILGGSVTDYFEKQDIMAVSVVSKLCVNFYLLLHLNRQKMPKPLAVGETLARTCEL
ncbi:hypothetical protein [Hoylesella saccharolytica]|jgi:hypothetical protein|uniref:hypothetical protein n=1 Tax=Hoylesella saccharolytica TaxID=633701 RepID=UPI0028E8B6E7|nr:hypothetical protein [Hoylesella saccharolytica]